jgi:hypothetical protein
VVPEHETIFRALAKLPAQTISNRREALLLALTRMGFPDIELEPLFRAKAPEEKEIPVLLTDL